MKQDVIHGGAGNDKIYGGTNDGFDGGDAGEQDSKYLYGDGGHDMIWGSNDLNEQYIRGGEGDDIIRSGGDIETSIIFGDDGDDIIYPGANGDDTAGGDEVDTIRAGKGNDIINPTTYF